MYIMLQDTPILHFNIDEGEYTVIEENLLPLRLRGIFQNNEEKNIKNMQKNYGALLDFLSHRVLNLDRANAKKILNTYNFSQSQDSITKAKIAITCKAVSMSDDYWINDDNKSFTWKNINLRKNSLNKIISHIALTGSSLTVEGKPHTPELTTQGVYAKAWIREEDGPYLYKASSKGNMESEIEIRVSNILDCFNIPHVKYEKAYWEDKDYDLDICKCCVMNNDRYSIVPAEDLYSYCCRKEIDFMKQTIAIDSENFYKTCVTDYLIANTDRHMQNWGFYMDNKTGILVSNHPLFDHNNAFDMENIKTNDGGKSLMMEDCSQKEAALYSVKRCNIKCISPVTKEMFIKDEHYESFMDRASELGLYKPKKKTFFQNIFNKTNLYEPVQIDKRTEINQEEYMCTNENPTEDINLFEEKLKALSNEQELTTTLENRLH